MGVGNPEQLAATLTSIVNDLSETRRQLRRLERSLPESNARADIQCSIVDRLTPLIESLRDLKRSATNPRESRR